jgi:hypothetical protein
MQQIADSPQQIDRPVQGTSVGFWQTGGPPQVSPIGQQPLFPDMTTQFCPYLQHALPSRYVDHMSLQI